LPLLTYANVSLSSVALESSKSLEDFFLVVKALDCMRDPLNP